MTKQERRVNEIIENSRRASHLKVCEICGKMYVNHTIDREVLKFYLDLYLHIICSGERVKL
jgi:ribosomal protein L32